MNEKEMNELNEKILQKENQYLTAEKEIAEGRLSLDNEMLVRQNVIEAEVDEQGKKKYSNADKRREALNWSLDDNHPLTTLRKQLKDDEVKAKMVLNEVSFLKRSLRIQEILSRCV